MLLGYRGKIMAEASSMPSSMVAVFGLPDADVEAVVEETAIQTGKIMSCTNYNCPGQVVIGGQAEAVDAATQALKERGARRCIPLNTSGPFHTALMNEASELLATRLKSMTLGAQRLPVIFNATAAPAANADIPALLARQIAAPVRFAQSVLALKETGITDIIEIGPGRVLAGLIKKIAPEITVTSIETTEDLEEVIAR